MSVRACMVAGVIVGSVLAAAGPASASFPGHDGSVAFVVPSSTCGTSVPAGSIWLSALNGSNSHLVAYGCFAEPKWSADGRYLAYVDSTSVHIWDDLHNTTRSMKLADGGGAALGGVAWSPDGTKLAFADASGIATIPAAGGSPVQLTRLPRSPYNSFQDYTPTWSPSGTTITYSENMSSTVSGDYMQYLLDVNVSTRAKSRLSAQCDFVSYSTPDYGPSGNNVVFTYDSAGCRPTTHGIGQINVATKHVTLFATNPAYENPVFEPNHGQHILFDDTQDVLMMASTPGAPATRVASGIEPDWQPLP